MLPCPQKELRDRTVSLKPKLDGFPEASWWKFCLPAAALSHVVKAVALRPWPKYFSRFIITILTSTVPEALPMSTTRIKRLDSSRCDR